MPEFQLIERIRLRARTGSDVLLGIGDDAALLQPPAGRQLVATQDTLHAGVHFSPGAAPADIGWKALAVNLSDLAAMGATPAWCLLSLSLPEADPRWVDALLDGFFALADAHRISLVGGDTTRGPLSLTITALGTVAPGRALQRTGARPGDSVWVTGTLGDAAAALALGDDAPPVLRARLDRPTPRVAAGSALAGLATACIDVSDGLLADLGHVLAASGVGAELDISALPASEALLGYGDDARRWRWQLAGGDDYELCFTAADRDADAVQRALQGLGVPATMIGRIVAGPGCVVRAPDGTVWQPPHRGYQHFAPTTP